MAPTALTAVHPHETILGTIYGDLGRIGEFAGEDMILHTADGGLVLGRQPVVEHELRLIDSTNGTLHMDVHHIVANDHFGAVLGQLRACLHDREMAMPFCGLWRFEAGRIVEHWENAYDSAALGAFLAG